MQRYKYPFVPGPTSVPKDISACYSVDYASSDLEDEFFVQYDLARGKLKRLLNCSGDVIIQSGEAMVALWGALKSCLRPKDRVLAISTGVYGEGIGEMAQQVGAEVHFVRFEWNSSVTNIERIRAEAHQFKPLLITAVHSETPCGTINPCDEIGRIAKEVGALFYVDFVSSGGGVDVNVDGWNIDLGLLGTQKCLSMPPDLGIVCVSQRASAVIDDIGYVGYDALKPWKGACEAKYFPYTHNWRAIAALNCALDRIFTEGVENVYNRHQECKTYCLHRIREMGLTPFVVDDSFASPTITAVNVPDGWSWENLDRALRAKGVCFGGSYGKIANKVFRIGHMGVQADKVLLKGALDTLESLISQDLATSSLDSANELSK